MNLDLILWHRACPELVEWALLPVTGFTNYQRLIAKGLFWIHFCHPGPSEIMKGRKQLKNKG
jgi:hypothetical protein